MFEVLRRVLATETGATNDCVVGDVQFSVFEGGFASGHRGKTVSFFSKKKHNSKSTEMRFIA